MVELRTPPEHLVGADGHAEIGVFDGRVLDANLVDARPPFAGHPMSPTLANLRLKEWQHFVLILPDLFVGIAVVDLAYVSTVWCSVVDRQSGHWFEHTRKVPFGPAHVSRNLADEHTTFTAKGVDVDIHNNLDAGCHHIRLRFAADRTRPEVEVLATALHDLAAIDPLEVSLPVGNDRVMYTHKVALPLQGSIRVGGQSHHAEPGTSHAILDIHKAHYPRKTFWKWATFAGFDIQGRRVAMNLTRNVCTDERYNENALWLNGRIRHLSRAEFIFERSRVLEPWFVRTTDGEVELEFRPQGKRWENFNAGLVRSVFQQPWGLFSGILRHGDESIEIKDQFGVCEDHEATW